jgi:protein-tyrosine phosphatase
MEEPLILFVCEGNVCRSPLAEGLLRSSFARHGVDIEVASAGTRALVDYPVDDPTALIAKRLGIDMTEHRGRQLTAEMVSSAKLALTATRRIRRAVVQLHAPAVQYTFTMRQFSRIMASAGEPFVANGGSSDSRVEAVSAFVSRHRGMQPPPDPEADDVVDPHGRTAAVHELAAQQMVPALHGLSTALGGLPISWPSWA